MQRHMKKFRLFLFALALTPCLISCSDDDAKITIHDPNTAQKVSVDRFSSSAGHLQVRTATHGLPAANAPLDFDKAPFITKGLGSDGRHAGYSPLRYVSAYDNAAFNDVDDSASAQAAASAGSGLANVNCPIGK
jgi:hypothetical protein